MRLRELPIVEQVFESGAEDRVFDGLLLTGPLVIVVIAILGRSPVTIGLAVAYILVFLAHTLGNALR